MLIWSVNKRNELDKELPKLPPYYDERVFNKKRFINNPRATSNAGAGAFQTTGVCNCGKPSISLVQALLRYKEIENTNGKVWNGGIGVLKGATGGVCEWVCEDYNSTIDVIYFENGATKTFMASKNNTPINLNDVNYAPFIFALIGWCAVKHPEFDEHLHAFVTADTSTPEGAEEELLALCRIAAFLEENVPIEVVNNTSLVFLTNSQKSSKRFEADLFAGKLNDFITTKKIKKTSFSSTKEFCGSFAGERVLTEQEKALVPELGESYVVPEEVVTICNMVQSTKSTNRPFRNILLRGDPSVGKTAGARAIAAGLGLPYVSITCNAGTEMYNLIGEMMPVAPNNAETVENLPTATEISMDPVTSYKMITGVEKEDATEQDCMEELLNRKTNQNGFAYIESPLVKAIRNGWVVELQEPSLIQRPGVLPGLNGLMDEGNIIVLPTGEVLERHPDCVIISTLNVDLNGCRPMNESFIDRHHIIMDMSLPSEDVIVERIKAMTGCDNTIDVLNMLQAVRKIAKIAENRGAMDGNLNSMRSLSNWVTAVMLTGDYHSSAEWTIISGATSDKEIRKEMSEAIKMFNFAGK